MTTKSWSFPQKADLSLISISIVGDQPTTSLQPVLPDGIHLRWSFIHQVSPLRKPGFPWHGYFLFRRVSDFREFICLNYDELFAQREPLLPTDPEMLKQRFSLGAQAPGRRVIVRFMLQENADTDVILLNGSLVIAQRTVQATAGEWIELSFVESDIVAIGFSDVAFETLEVCFTPQAWDHQSGWERLDNFPYPLTLPIFHPDYPPTSGALIDLATAEALALSRVRYGSPNEWAGQPFADMHEQLMHLVKGGPPPSGKAMEDPARAIEYPSTAIGREQPRLLPIQPLDLLLLASINPALAQILGLYWLDRSIDSTLTYDYLLVADHKGLFTSEFMVDLSQALTKLFTGALPDTHFAVLYDQQLQPSLPVDVPQDVRVYALPSGPAVDGQLGGTNLAGLRWDTGMSALGYLRSGHAVAYQLWRTHYGEYEPAQSAPPAQFQLLTKNQPIMISKPTFNPGEKVDRPPDWPPYPLHTLDQGAPDGWYSYAVSGIDLFGRYSLPSDPARWFQWDAGNIGNFASYYYLQVPGETLKHPFAVHLIDLIPPPPPTDVEAVILDPLDRMVIQDNAYTAWRNANPQSVGLRVKWRWRQTAMRQAPDVQEFRIYYQLGTLNVLLGRITSVSPAGAGESLVETDISHSAAVGAYINTWLRVGEMNFPIFQSEAGNPLRLHVHHVGVKSDIAPIASAWCSVLLPPNHPLTLDFCESLNWDQRYHIVSYFAPAVADANERQYDVFLAEPSGLNPSLAEPIVYGHIGVSAADDKLRPDQRIAGAWSNRPGNEGPVGAPSKIYRILRTPPPPPVPPPDSERVYATPADYHGNSYYSVRWPPQKYLKAHVFRALDHTLFKGDWVNRPRPPLSTADKQYFMPKYQADDPATVAGRQRIVEALNRLNTFAGNASQAMAWYRGLSNDALQVLATLPGTERAFMQITVLALDPNDPSYANRRGPDDPANFQLDDPASPLTSSAWRVYLDKLDGRSTNRYFYRVAYVDAANNRSAFGMSSPPVWLPNVVPPSPPVVTKILGGDQAVTLRWASNREPDLVEYRVYRTDQPEQARDLRLMTLIHTETVPPGEPAARPNEIAWIDEPVLGLVNFYYRVVAVDEARNISQPSAIVIGRAYDESMPTVPPLIVAWTDIEPVSARATWIAAENTRLERRLGLTGLWEVVTDWLSPGSHQIDDLANPKFPYFYRLRVRKGTVGAESIGARVNLPAKE